MLRGSVVPYGISGRTRSAEREIRKAVKRLTFKQEAFVNEYLVDLNATEAAVRAGYSEKTAGKIGSENLKKPEISMAIAEKMKQRESRTQITQDFVLTELYEIARKEASDFPESDLKYSNKLKALELLGKHLGMFTERLNVETAVPVKIVDDMNA